MKRIILVGFGLFVSMALASAQPIPDASYTDCNNQTQSIYQVLAAGKVLLVANAGTNCSICMSHANGVGDVADNNLNTIAVWGSMTTKNGGQVNCSAINSWVTTYGWANVFAFADVNKDWFNVATPQYTVISPADSTIVYQGSNWNTAKQTAENLANTIGIPDIGLQANLTFRPNQIDVSLSNTKEQLVVTLYNIAGASVASATASQTSEIQLQFPEALPPGIYLLHIRSENAEKVYKIHL